jgi:hypothetical protein
MLGNGMVLFLATYWLLLIAVMSFGDVADLELVGLELTGTGRQSKYCWGQIQTLLMFS